MTLVADFFSKLFKLYVIYLGVCAGAAGVVFLGYEGNVILKEVATYMPPLQPEGGFLKPIVWLVIGWFSVNFLLLNWIVFLWMANRSHSEMWRFSFSVSGRLLTTGWLLGVGLAASLVVWYLFSGKSVLLEWVSILNVVLVIVPFATVNFLKHLQRRDNDRGRALSSRWRDRRD
jgi:hypothetical protein